MSVGHATREFEAAGIATVIVASEPFRPTLEVMSLPRVLLTPHPMSRPLGRPGDSERQIKVIKKALALLENADTPKIIKMSGDYINS